MIAKKTVKCQCAKQCKSVKVQKKAALPKRNSKGQFVKTISKKK